MKLIDRNAGDAGSSGSEGCGVGGRTVLVGVKLDPRSRELLTWSLVKVAEPGDLVIALHVLDSTTEGTASLLSLVKTFDSVLAVYEGFCNLKQVDLRLKVSRGPSVRKLLVQEAKSLGAATVVVGISKTHHTIRSSASLAKYCARKSPKFISVFAVDNGKIAFHREATNIDQVKLNEGATLSRNPFSACADKNLKNCESCARVSELPEDSATELTQGLFDDQEDKNSLALVPIQKSDEASSHSMVVQEPPLAKPGLSRLRRAFLPRKHIQKSVVRNASVFQRGLRQAGGHSSAVVHPDQKQIDIDKNGDYALDGMSDDIVTFGSAAIIPPPPLCSGLSGLPKNLLELKEKYSSSCRLYSVEELVSATTNFSSDNLVGKGGSSHVYRGIPSDGKELAVKVLKPSEHVIKEFIQEIGIITTLGHKNIISLSGFCFGDNNNLLLVYNFLSRGSLEENLHGNKKDCIAFGWQERYKVAVGVAEALDYLHNGCAQPVIHRDVKSSNILLSDDFEPQLSDFGLASWGSSSHITSTELAGTFGYLAPEYLMHGRVTDKIDVYAFGIVLLELLSNRKPINNDCPKGQESLVMWARQVLKDGKPYQLLDLSLGGDYNCSQIERMVLAATLCIKQAPTYRPQISLIFKLLLGDEEVIRWAKQEVSAPEEVDGFDGDPVPSNIQSHLNLALLDLEDDAVSVSSAEQHCVSMEDYLQGRWSRSSSFD